LVDLPPALPAAAFSMNDEPCTATLAAQLAALRSGFAEQNRLLAAFEQIGCATLSSLDLEQLLDTLATQVIRTGIFRSLMIALVEPETDSIVVVRSLIHQGLAFNKEFVLDEDGSKVQNPQRVLDDVVGFRYALDEDNVTATTARTGEMQVVTEWSDHLDPRVNQPNERRGKVAYFIPVKQQDRVLAVLATGSQIEDRENVLNRIEKMQPLLDQIAIALEHARLYNEVRTGRERMQRLSRRLVQVQEEERQALARELHDEIGQTLTGLNLLLRTVPRQPDERANMAMNRAQELVHELAANVHDLSLDLRPSMLDDHGLLQALASHFLRYTDQTEVAVRFKHDGLEKELPREVRTAAFRIVQEALTNVARHAEVAEVHVRLWSTADSIGIQVEDEGNGFAGAGGHMAELTGGVTGMKERALLLGGRLTIDSTPGRGTCLLAELPVADEPTRLKETNEGLTGG
jgi:signal transduction histidine kinase